MSTLNAYDPKKVVVNLGGETVTGYAPDTKAVISRSNNISTKTEGVDGDLSINIDSRFSGTLTVSLLHNSSFNKTMVKWVYQLEQSGFPFFPVSFKDPSGLSLTTTGWVEVQPDYSAAQETGVMEWVIGLKDSRLAPSNATSVGAKVFELAKSVLL